MPDHVHMIVEIPYRGEREEQSPSPTMGIADIMCAFKSITTKNAIFLKIVLNDKYGNVVITTI